MINLQLVILCIFGFIFYTFLLWSCFSVIHASATTDAEEYFVTQHKLRTYKQNMQNAQNKAKQYKSTLKNKKKAYKSLQRNYICLEQENKCLKAKLCESGDVE